MNMPAATAPTTSSVAVKGFVNSGKIIGNMDKAITAGISFCAVSPIAPSWLDAIITPVVAKAPTPIIAPRPRPMPIPIPRLPAIAPSWVVCAISLCKILSFRASTLFFALTIMFCF
jgi:hypothetical protein